MDAYRAEVRRETDAEGDAVDDTIEAVLSTLGERISREEAKRIAGQLPDEAETWVIDWDAESEADFDVDEFLARVADDLDVSKNEAQHRSQVVLDHLEVELTGGEERKLRNQLPESYETVL